MTLRIGPAALILAIYGITLVTAFPAWADADCAAKVKAACTQCHFPTRICENLGKKSQRDWKVTIKRMIRYGLVLNDTDQGDMLKCLLALDRNSGNLCR